MAFRKRNVVISDSSTPRAPMPAEAASPTNPDSPRSPVKLTPSTQPAAQIPGVRPSPVSGTPTTSTGAPTLDALCGGHGGIPLGSLLLIEESSTTDFAGALLRYYAAEGVAQGHQVIVLHSGDTWIKELPAVTGVVDDNDGDSESSKKSSKSKEKDRMKIAWRYEGLGSFGSGIHTMRETPTSPKPVDKAPVSGQTSAPSSSQSTSSQPHTVQQAPFCHTYDLTKRMVFPDGKGKPDILQLPQLDLPLNQPPFHHLLQSLSSRLANLPPTTVVRIVIPNFLSPMLYPPAASHPQHSLQFLHSLRSLLRRHASKATAMMSFPLALYPRTSGFVRWVENIADGVVELTPLSSLAERAEAGKTREDSPQGLVRVWKAVDSDMGKSRGVKRGSSWSGLGMEGGDDLAFTLTRRRFGIVSYSLPPADDDSGGGGGGGGGGDAESPQNPGKSETGGGKQTKLNLEF